MGKKGKVSLGRDSGYGKGSFNAQLRDIHTSINYARRMAYDHTAIENKKSELARSQRRRLIFPHLNSLIMQRARDDVRGGAVPGTTYDRSWEEYFVRLGSKDQRTTTAEVITKNMKNKFYSWRLPIPNDRVVPTLSSLCIQAIANSLSLYSPDDVQVALSTVSHQKTEQLSLLASINGALRDEYMVCFQHELLERLVLSEHISDQGINSLLASTLNSANSHFQTLDSWETIELSELNTFTCVNLCDLTLLSSVVSTASLTLLDDHCAHLQRLCLHDVQFATEARQADPMVFCLQVLDTLGTGFRALVTLELHYCHWVRLQALELWARRVELLRARDACTLHCLKYFTIAGVEDLLTEKSGAHSSGAGEGEEEDVEWEPVHPLFATTGMQVAQNHAQMNAQTNTHHMHNAQNVGNNSSARNSFIVAQLYDLYKSRCGVEVSIEML